jgi:N-carbamoyl-L-amino-acid hydrolase
LGLLAALEVLQVVQENSISLPYDLEAVDFTDEEGTLVGLLGSLALTGKLSPQDLSEPRGGQEALKAGLSRAGLSREGLLNAQRDATTLAGYLELHIEQGRRLKNMGADLGVVTSIAGIGSTRLTFVGRADHAGTTPLVDRLDAAQGASAFTLNVREILLNRYPQCVANVGSINLEPGAFNIVPERAILSLEYRAPDTDSFQRLETSLLDSAQELAERYQLALEVEYLGKTPPAPMDPTAQKSILRAAEILTLKAVPLSSGAGHDAQSFSDICPTGMIFVPSEEGASHSPREFTKWEDCIKGANALLQTTLIMAGQLPE